MLTTPYSHVETVSPRPGIERTEIGSLSLPITWGLTRFGEPALAGFNK